MAASLWNKAGSKVCQLAAQSEDLSNAKNQNRGQRKQKGIRQGKPNALFTSRCKESQRGLGCRRDGGNQLKHLTFIKQ